MSSTISTHIYEVRPRKDHRGVNLISDALPFGRLWYEQAPNAVEYAKFYSRSHDAVIRVYDAAGNVVETRSRRLAAKSIAPKSDATSFRLLSSLLPTELSSVGKVSFGPLV